MAESLIQRYRSHYRDLAAQGPDAFFTGFDGGRTAEEYFQRAAWNYEHNIKAHIPADHGLTCLDLGYGGGGMLRAAADDYDTLHGLDVHGERSLVSKYINHPDVRLYKSGGWLILRRPDSISVLWSWVTFMHLESAGVAQSYLREIARVLAPGGTALIWYCPHEDDKRARELPPQINKCSLQAGDGAMRKWAEAAGLTVQKIVNSKRQSGGGGWQHGMVMTK